MSSASDLSHLLPRGRCVISDGGLYASVISSLDAPSPQPRALQAQLFPTVPAATAAEPLLFEPATHPFPVFRTSAQLQTLFPYISIAIPLAITDGVYAYPLLFAPGDRVSDPPPSAPPRSSYSSSSLQSPTHLSRQKPGQGAVPPVSAKSSFPRSQLAHLLAHAANHPATMGVLDTVREQLLAAAKGQDVAGEPNVPTIATRADGSLNETGFVDTWVQLRKRSRALMLASAPEMITEASISATPGNFSHANADVLAAWLTLLLAVAVVVPDDLARSAFESFSSQFQAPPPHAPRTFEAILCESAGKGAPHHTLQLAAVGATNSATASTGSGIVTYSIGRVYFTVREWEGLAVPLVQLLKMTRLKIQATQGDPSIPPALPLPLSVQRADAFAPSTPAQQRQMWAHNWSAMASSRTDRLKAIAHLFHAWHVAAIES